MRDVLWHGKDVLAALQAHLTASPGDDWQAQGVAIDTRDLLAGDIFVALPGEKHMAMIMSRKLSKMARRRLWSARF